MGSKAEIEGGGDFIVISMGKVCMSLVFIHFDFCFLFPSSQIFLFS